MNKVLKFIARHGNVGGTARFVANGYKHFEKRGLKRGDIFEEIIKVRFKILKSETEENEMLKKAKVLNNLTDLTFLILQVEGVIPKDDPVFKNIGYIEIIREELRKKGLSEEIIGIIS